MSRRELEGFLINQRPAISKPAVMQPLTQSRERHVVGKVRIPDALAQGFTPGGTGTLATRPLSRGSRIYPSRGAQHMRCDLRRKWIGSRYLLMRGDTERAIRTAYTRQQHADGATRGMLGRHNGPPERMAVEARGDTRFDQSTSRVPSRELVLLASEDQGARSQASDARVRSTKVKESVTSGKSLNCPATQGRHSPAAVGRWRLWREVAGSRVSKPPRTPCFWPMVPPARRCRCGK